VQVPDEAGNGPAKVTLSFPGWKAAKVAPATFDIPVDPLPQGPKQRARLRGHTNEVRSIAITPDGRTLISASNDRTIKIWDLATGRERTTLRGHKGPVAMVAISPDGRTLASGGDDGTVKLWDLHRLQERARLAARNHGTRPFMALSPDGKTLATGPHGGMVKLWAVGAGKERATLGENKLGIWSIAFSPDGKTLASVGSDSLVRLWDLPLGRERAAFSFPNDDRGSTVAFSPDGKTLAAGRSDGFIKLWEVATGRERASLAGKSSRVQCLAFSPDGKILAAGLGDGKTRLWELPTGKEPASLKGDNDKVFSVAFTPDGKTLAVAEAPDTTIRLWDVSALTCPVPSSPTQLSDKDLWALWTDLAGADARVAYRAIWSLAAAERQTVPWLKERLHPVAPAEPQRIARLIAALNSDRYVIRKKASQELTHLGESAVPALRKILTKPPSPDARRLAERLLQELEKQDGHPERLRVLRAIEILEHIGTGAARRMLKQLAAGMPEARATQEARQSLKRLDKRAASAIMRSR
jgi:dipeptidyl aminopeptidase/acylaminoacyl peptidase